MRADNPGNRREVSDLILHAPREMLFEAARACEHAEGLHVAFIASDFLRELGGLPETEWTNPIRLRFVEDAGHPGVVEIQAKELSDEDVVELMKARRDHGEHGYDDPPATPGATE